jgi:hypothetical protein
VDSSVTASKRTPDDYSCAREFPQPHAFRVAHADFACSQVPLAVGKPPAVPSAPRASTRDADSTAAVVLLVV